MEPRRFIACAGGGVRGAHPGWCASKLTRLRHPLATANEISGVSAGSILAASLATGYDPSGAVNELIQMNIVPPRSAMNNVFRAVKMARGKYKSLYKSDGLARLLDDTVVGRTVTIDKLSIIAGNGEELTQEEFTFEKGDRIEVQPILASCAILGVFPPVRINGVDYIDGGYERSFPEESIKRFMEYDSSATLVLYSSSPWPGNFARVTTGEFSVPNAAKALMHIYWNKLCDNDHRGTLRMVGYEERDAPDGRFAIVLKPNEEGKWTKVQVVTPKTPAADVITTEPRKVVYCVAPKGYIFKQYESITLATPAGKRVDILNWVAKQGEYAASDVIRMHSMLYPDEAMAAPKVIAVPPTAPRLRLLF